MLLFKIILKGYFTSGKMKVYLILVIYIIEMWNYFWNWSFVDWENAENVFFTHVAERLQLPERNCFAALTRPLPNHAYRLQVAESKKWIQLGCFDTSWVIWYISIEMVLNCIVPGCTCYTEGGVKWRESKSKHFN